MHSVFGWIVAIFAAFWFFRIGIRVAGGLTASTPLRWVSGVMALLIVFGAGGFFAAILSALGILKLPNSFEWPAGYVNGVAQAIDGMYVVPLVPSGRIQIYDSDWHFLRGWHVEADAGDFNVESLPDGRIEVLTVRGRHRYLFTETGELISATTVPNTVSLLQKTGISVIVPTSPLLWIFSSPFLSMGTAAIGFIGLSTVKKSAHPKTQQKM